MIKIPLKVIDAAGLHARPASILAAAAGKYSSKLEIEHNGKRSNLKSIIGILALGITVDSEIAICADGEDAVSALTSMVELIKENSIAR
ncbi:MAG: HPr family phosphocarrier protein [Alkaliphilus sp.]|nr:HPr family phosphocarrier protein [Alkaliphilus sp.]